MRAPRRRWGSVLLRQWCCMFDASMPVCAVGGAKNGTEVDLGVRRPPTHIPRDVRKSSAALRIDRHGTDMQARMIRGPFSLQVLRASELPHRGENARLSLTWSHKHACCPQASTWRLHPRQGPVRLLTCRDVIYQTGRLPGRPRQLSHLVSIGVWILFGKWHSWPRRPSLASFPGPSTKFPRPSHVACTAHAPGAFLHIALRYPNAIACY